MSVLPLPSNGTRSAALLSKLAVVPSALTQTAVDDPLLGLSPAMLAMIARPAEMSQTTAWVEPAGSPGREGSLLGKAT